MNLIDANKDASSVIILINEMDKEIIQRAIVSFERLEISHIPENFTNESVLKKAFLDKAKTFMILPDASRSVRQDHKCFCLIQKCFF